MITVLKYKEILLDSFYLDKNSLTIRRKKDCSIKGKYNIQALSTNPYLCRLFFNQLKRKYKWTEIPSQD